MFLLELDDDSSDFFWAASLWLLAVAALVMYSRYVRQRDAMRIDAQAVGPVGLVRERVQRQRSGEVDAHGAVASASSASPSAPRVPRSEADDCPICLDKISWPVDLNCAHTFCAQCFVSYHEQQRAEGGQVKCPCCRRACDVVLPTEPGWTQAEQDSAQGRKLKAEIDRYNARFSREPRQWAAVAQDAPHYLRRFWVELTSGGEGSMRLIRQMRLWVVVASSMLYLFSPLDIIPEAIFGLFGYLDDVIVLVFGLLMVAGIFRSMQLQQAEQER